MLSKEKQIKGILSGDVKSQLPWSADLENSTFYDYISVTPDEVLSHVLVNGFSRNGPVVELSPGDPQVDDRIVVRQQGSKWEIVYSERGYTKILGTDPNREGALRLAILELFHSAWRGLNAAYRNKHLPGTSLPKYGERFPP